MNERQCIDKYPWRKIVPRWILGITEIGLSVYFVIRANENLGLFFAAWWAVSLFVLLPLIRCIHCFYYGKRCNTAWGLITGFSFAKGETKFFQSGYGLTFLLWPLRILPFFFGFKDLLGATMEWEFAFNPNGLFGIYVLTLVIHRLYYRKSNCPSCYQKSLCPVYNPQAMVEPVDSDAQSLADNQ
ncbi:MAG: hypothetical protein GX409_07925 [candidate division Zixibacteria bacterium]|jgi:hypothetical protein|nr:hypothetical protein [candidate division Zixibacteria bacterium]